MQKQKQDKTGVSPTSYRLDTYSVALCTYQGMHFIPLQLTSILEATPACAQLVLVDDASNDATVEVARSLLASWPGRHLIEVNKANRGSLRSFEQALRQTTEPIVFLADQDDRWCSNKPALMLEQFAERPDLLLLHSNARLVDDTMSGLGHTLFDAVEASSVELATIRDGDAFDTFVKRNLATGATIAMRRSLLEVALPIPDGWVHDEWLAVIASAIGTVDYLNTPLIDYRQHAGNQIGARKLSFLTKIAKAFDKPGDYYEKQLLKATGLLDRLTMIGPRVPADRLMKVRAKLRHLQMRAALPRNRFARVRPVMREWMAGGYLRYSTGMKSALRDLLHEA